MICFETQEAEGVSSAGYCECWRQVRSHRPRYTRLLSSPSMVDARATIDDSLIMVEAPLDVGHFTKCTQHL